MGVLRVRDIAGWLEDAYPSALAEDWDRVGLSVGDPDAQVDAVVLSVDVTDAVLAEAKRVGAQLIVSHHPLLLRGCACGARGRPEGAPAHRGDPVGNRCRQRAYQR
ncbi:Nif3-like dinuclear metal center hexameric protein [Propioniciclava flava]